MRSDTPTPWRYKLPWPSIDSQIKRIPADARHDPEPIRFQSALTGGEVAAAVEFARQDPRRVLAGWRNPAIVVVDKLLRDARDSGPIGQVARRAVRLMVEPDRAEDEDPEA